MLGQFLVHMYLGLTVAIAIGYWYASIKHNQAVITFTRKLYIASVALIVAISGLLLYHITTHNFDYTYVQSYSSRQLDPPFLYAAFYSGQEGSFLLWTLLTAIVGVAVIEYSKRRAIEAETMAFFSLILVFLALMLTAKNPFAYLWETYAQDGTTREFIEALRNDPTRYNGRGLNPVLQNYWVMIHPPMLFSGFAMVSAPFAIAMAGLWRRRYHEWTRIAQPWLLAATFVLGIGIVLGGLWAYETLGWGGFWAWDPVENSSLVPWLFVVALLHTTIIQRRTKGLVRTNFLLAIAAFAAVLYSTFLTRSGVLGDTSVHSFVEPGYFVYVLLLLFLSSFLVLGLGLLSMRFREMSVSTQRVKSFAITSREFILALGAICLVTSAVVVLLGTSYPIVAEIIGKPKVAIEATFYNKAHIPLTAALLLINGLSLVASWSSTDTRKFTGEFLRFVLLSVCLVGIGLATGIIATIGGAALSLGALIAIAINGRQIVRLIASKKFIAVGAFVSHVGLAILVIGIVLLSRQPDPVHVRLIEGKSASVLGYTFTLLGKHQIETHLSDREKYRYVVAVEQGTKRHYAYPVVYFSDFNQRQAPFLEPGIVRSLSGDVYIAPKALDIEESSSSLTLTKHEAARVPADTNWTIELVAFDMSKAQMSDVAGALQLGVRIRLTSRNGRMLDTTLYTFFDGRTFVPRTVSINGVPFPMSLVRIQRNPDQPERSTAVIRFDDPGRTDATRQVLVVDVSLKPMINLVWCGFLVTLAGVFLSTVRSFRSTKASAPTSAATRTTSPETESLATATVPASERSS